MDAVCPKCHRKFAMPDNAPPPPPGRVAAASCPFCGEKKPVHAFVHEYERVQLAAAAAASRAKKERERQEQIAIKTEEKERKRRAQAARQEAISRAAAPSHRAKRQKEAQQNVNGARHRFLSVWKGRGASDDQRVSRFRKSDVNWGLRILSVAAKVLGAAGLLVFGVGVLALVVGVSEGHMEAVVIILPAMGVGFALIVVGALYQALTGIWSAVERMATMMEEREQQSAEPEPVHPPTEAGDADNARS